MTTVIDELIVLLRLDGKGFKEDQKKTREDLKKTKDAATDSSKEMELRAKRSIEAYSKFRNEVIALFTAFTAGEGIKNFVENTIKTEASLGRLSTTLGISIEDLSAWQNALKRNGGTAEDATSAFRTMAAAQTELLSTGTLANGGLWASLGVQGDDIRLGKSAETIEKLAANAAKLGPVLGAQRLQQLGFTESMAQFMVIHGQAVQQQIDASRKLGVTTAKDVAAAQELQDTMEGLKNTFIRVGQQILTTFEPAMKRIADFLTRLGQWAQQNRPIIVGVFTGLTVGLSLFAAAAAIAAIAADPLLQAITLIAFASGAAGASIGSVNDNLDALSRMLKPIADDFVWMGQQLRAAFVDSGIVDAVAQLLDALRPLGHLLAIIGKVFVNDFGPVVIAAVKFAIDLLAGAVRILGDDLRLITDLLTGHWQAAWADAKKFALDAIGGISTATKDLGILIINTLKAINPLAHNPNLIPAPTGAGRPPTGSGASATGSVLDQGDAGRLRQLGIPSAVAQGIAAGIQAEGGADTNAFNPAGGGQGAWGIGQWRGARLAELRRRYGPNPTRDQQLQFLAWELKGGDAQSAAVLRETSAQGAMRSYIVNAMRPGVGTAGDLRRGAAYLAANGNVPQQYAAALSPGGGGGSQTINIGTISINAPNARNAGEIAKEIGPALRKRGITAQVSAGIG